MEYLVTGATGLIGRHVVDELLERSHDVVALAWSATDDRALPEAVTVAEGDIREKETLREPMRGVDGVFHLAAWYFVGPGPWSVETAERTNVEGTRNVLEVMDELDIEKGVYTSTIAVYPSPDVPVIDESHRPACPTTAVYDRTKWEAHFEVAQPMIDDGLPLVITIPGGVYGPGDKPRGSLRELFRSYLSDELLAIPNEVTVPLDYVVDCARAHVDAMAHGEPGESYIIANEPRNLVDVFRTAEAVSGMPAPRVVSWRWFAGLARVMSVAERIVRPPVGYESERLRAFAYTDLPVDNSKAREAFGLKHRPLEDGLREYFAWERARLEE